MNTNLRWVGALVAVGVLASVPSCSGQAFCEDTRTCQGAAAPVEGGSDGESGGAPSAVAGASAGGDHSAVAGSENVGGGDAGTPGMVPNACTTDADCDDKDSCTGVETCVEGACIAGKSVECSTGLVCSSAKDAACVFKTDAPWILYQASDDQKRTTGVYAVKQDLIGEMDPVKLDPELDPDMVVNYAGWLQDGIGAYIVAYDKANTKSDLYWVPFGDGLPSDAILLTRDLPKSSYTSPAFAVDGKVLGVWRNDGLYALDINTASITGGVESRLNSDTYSDAQPALLSADKSIFLGTNKLTGNIDVVVAKRTGNTWNESVLVPNLPLDLPAAFNGDGSLLFHTLLDAKNVQTVWAIETEPGSKNVKVFGPVVDWSISTSPDKSKVLLATSDGMLTTVRGGAASSLNALPTIRQDLSVLPADVFSDNVWSPDSARAALFQGVANPDDRDHRALVVHEPALAPGQAWAVIPNLIQKYTDPGPQWTHDSTSLAIVWRNQGMGAATLDFVTPPGGQRYVDRVEDLLGTLTPRGFSAHDEYFAYIKSATANGAGQAYYVDLSEGVARSFNPVLIDSEVRSLGFGLQGTGILYATTTDCFYFDPAKDADTDPVQVNDSTFALSCLLQPLPPK